MTSNWEWREVHSIGLDDWPLSDSGDGQETANELTPPNHYWFRRVLEDGTVRYLLMKFEGEYNLE